MSRAICLLAVALGLAFATPAFADEKPTPAERLKAIRKDVADAEAAFRAARAKLPDPDQEDPEGEKLYQVFIDRRKAGFAAALEIAMADPKSEPGFDALEWLVVTPGSSSSPAGRSAMAIMAEQHAANPKVGKAVAVVAFLPPRGEGDKVYPEALALIKAVAAKNPDRVARGQAVIGSAWLAKHAFREGEAQGSPDVDRLAQEAEKAFDGVVKDYGDCLWLNTRPRRPPETLGEKAKIELFELGHLRVGMPAPEIEGEDLDGKWFKLSNSRGKVTLLVFWASWCGPCMREVPHQRELVDRFKDRPFVLVGVNGDEKKSTVHKAVEQMKINWRSFWNEDKGPYGPIAMAWNVRAWPTVYVIDEKGVIRSKHLGHKMLDEALEKLVLEAEKAKGK